MRKYWLLCLLLVSLALLSCDGSVREGTAARPTVTKVSENGDTVRYEDLSGVYECHPLTVPGSLALQKRSHLSNFPAQWAETDGTNAMFYAIGNTVSSASLAVFDETGSMTRTVSLAHLQVSGMDRSRYYTFGTEGNFLVGPALDEDGRRIVHLYGEDGTLLGASAPLYPATTLDSFLCIGPTACLAAPNDGSGAVYLLNASLESSPPLYPESPIVSGFLHEDGRQILLCENNACLWYNEDAQTLVPITLVWDNIIGSTDTVLYAADGTGYRINFDGITVWRDGEEQLLCDFAASYFNRAQFSFIGVLPGDRFLVWYTERLTGEETPAIFAPTEQQSRPVRETVRVASVGCDPTTEKEQSALIAASVSYFNRTDDEYEIVLDDFDRMARYDENGNRIIDDVTEQRDKLFEDALLSGERYDVYLIGASYQGVERLVEKGVFADISAFARRQKLIACADTVQYGIPLSMAMSTLVTSTDILPMGIPFTYETLFEILGGLHADESLSCHDLRRGMYEIALYDFVDWEGGTCTFDSPEFIRMLSFFRDYDNALLNGSIQYVWEINNRYMNAADGSFQSGAGYVAVLGDLAAQLTEGSIRFLELNIGSPETVSAVTKLFSDLGLEIRFCGYPSADGGSIRSQPNLTMYVGAETVTRQGALSYLSLMLSDRIQTAGHLGGFPVTVSAVEARLSHGYHYYFHETVSDDVYGSQYLLMYRTASKTALPAETAIQYNASMQLLKPEQQKMVSYITESSMRGAGDTVIRSIIEEELSYAAQGVRTVEEAAKIIQSRVFIYINE